MLYYATKLVLSALIIVVVSEVAKFRESTMAVTALPPRSLSLAIPQTTAFEPT